ncbi:hypothetical protein KEM60_03106 [Austwickia sp. TVS 96-490-7B]|uniref:sugar phosphate isomerase/epimerase family protein n=1 Tax=Austwickia sp. TVS 96-490-7B TaxID=2830843 RepID=UPI001C56E9D0|nr:TIM barrel protein [Austwickia sp. TVS 96-490-7B]MBW3086877.1 hypothetical protein [Austwickia sp. TVS 96-490-7B]
MPGVAPHLMVENAAHAGFDFVGLQLTPGVGARTGRVYGGAASCEMHAGGVESRRTARALIANGVLLEDISGVLLDGRTEAAQWLPVLEAGAALGAKTLTVTITDPDATRRDDHLAALVHDARGHGIVPAIEPAARSAVPHLMEAADLARRWDCLILPDLLHHHRSRATSAQIAAYADLVVMVQLCDVAPLAGGPRSPRVLPGDGIADIGAFLSAFPDRLPVSVEVPWVRSGRRDAASWARTAFAASRASVEAAGLFAAWGSVESW